MKTNHNCYLYIHPFKSVQTVIWITIQHGVHLSPRECHPSLSMPWKSLEACPPPSKPEGGSSQSQGCNVGSPVFVLPHSFPLLSVTRQVREAALLRRTTTHLDEIPQADPSSTTPFTQQHRYFQRYAQAHGARLSTTGTFQATR